MLGVFDSSSFDEHPSPYLIDHDVLFLLVDTSKGPQNQIKHSFIMSTLLKTTSKAASNAKSKSKGLPRSDVRAAEQDMALEAGIAMSGEEDSEDDEEEDVEMIDDEEEEEEEAAPVKKSKKVEKGKGKELKKKVVPETTTTLDKVDKAVQRRKDKVLMLSSRGITGRMRHLMLDLEAILPHLKKGKPCIPHCCLAILDADHLVSPLSIDAKLDSKSSLHLVNELADLHSCNNTLYFEARRHEDLYLWLSRSPNGPSVKCHVQNIHTMDELKMTGNCLKGSRGLVCFDGGWEGGEEWKLLREMLTHVSRDEMRVVVVVNRQLG